MYKILILFLLFFLMNSAFAIMISPSMDDPQKPFSYFSKPTDEIGVMDEPLATEITPEGYLYTGFGELMFFVGAEKIPVVQRHRTLEQGFLPIIHYDFKHEDLLYSFTIFSALVPMQKSKQQINFIRVTIHNMTNEPRRADFAIGFRYQKNVNTVDGVSENRFKRPFPKKKLGNYWQMGEKFNPNWIYEFKENAFCRNKKILYIFNQPPTQRTFTLEYNGYKAHNLTPRKLRILPTTPVGITHFAFDLKGKEDVQLDFKMPIVPASLKDMSALAVADFDVFKNKTIEIWQNIIAAGMQLDLPEKKVVDTFKASLIYDLLAKDKVNNHYIQTVNLLHYHEFFLRDAADIAYMYDITGYPKYARQVLDFFPNWQKKDGNFLSQPEQYDGFGQVLWAYGQHYSMTKDGSFAVSRIPSIMRAISWLKKARNSDSLHLIPISHVKDNENIIGHITGYNFLALAGLNKVIPMLKAVGENKKTQEVETEYQNYKAILLKLLNKIAQKTSDYIPPTLDGKIAGQNWGNLLGAYPIEILDPWDKKISATLNKTRQQYQEGLITYADGKFLHHYLTIKNTLTALLRGEQKQVITEFYNLLLHTSSTHAGFEFCIEPWADRNFRANLSPHGWFAAEYRTLLRKMFVREHDQDLHLFSAISPAWIGAGKKIELKNVPTEFGRVDLQLEQRDEQHAIFHLIAHWENPPQKIIFHIPWFMTLKNFKSDANFLAQRSNEIWLPANTKKIELIWIPKKSEQNFNYLLTVKNYKKEYARRFELFKRGL